jgi:hypothetical protein
MKTGTNENKRGKKSKNIHHKQNTTIIPGSSPSNKTFNKLSKNIQKTNRKRLSRIVKLEVSSETAKNNLKIDFSRDPNLVDKLFSLKDLVTIKRKSFI